MSKNVVTLYTEEGNGKGVLKNIDELVGGAKVVLLKYPSEEKTNLTKSQFAEELGITEQEVDLLYVRSTQIFKKSAWDLEPFLINPIFEDARVYGCMSIIYNFSFGSPASGTSNYPVCASKIINLPLISNAKFSINKWN